MEPSERMRLDELAHRSGVATTTIRLYQNKGLLPRPRLEGRTGYYDGSHLARLALIGRLQDQGFSLAGIGRLLEVWEQGRDLADLVDVEHQLDVLLNPGHESVLEPDELLARFPPGSLTPEHVQRAASLGLVDQLDDGRLRVPDSRFLAAGATLIELGVPTAVVLDEWAHLQGLTDEIARRFVAVFEDHLVPAAWRSGPADRAPDADGDRATELAATLARLRHTARQVVAAALDASIARQGARRLARLVPSVSRGGGSA